jgi:hypothetical protein
VPVLHADDGFAQQLSCCIFAQQLAGRCSVRPGVAR